MEQIAALLAERPNDVNFELFEKTAEVQFIEKYVKEFGVLPYTEVFEKEFSLQLPHSHAPWRFYERKLNEEKFIRDAIPALTNFNKTYEKDQTQALLKLREQLVSLAEPTVMEPVSIIKDRTRFEHFKQQENARILTGIKPLDEACGGVSRTDEFMIISARLGIGKSWLSHFIAKNMAVNGYRVGIYSGEMSEHDVGGRVDSLLSHLSNFALTRGRLTDLDDHMQKLDEVQGDILILTPNQLRRNASPADLRKFIVDQELDCIIIDQLSLMEVDGGYRAAALHERMYNLSLQLKSLQQEMRVPIIAVSQLNRGAAQQEADASNIAGSDRIGQDATLILSLARKDADTLKIKVLKARSFRMPDQPWEFTWDIDKGILAPKLSALDAVAAKVQQATLREETLAQTATSFAPQEEDEEDEIW